MPLISVIVPAYNAQSTIGETVESILNQTFTDFELIVVNDGSTDNTLDIVSSFNDPRLEVFSYPNAGVSASRNRGTSHAIGTYVSFIDADDLWTPDKLEAQIDALENEPQAAVAYSWTNLIDQSGRFLVRGKYATYSGNVYAELLVGNFLESASNILLRRQAFIDVGGFDETLSGAADRDFFTRLAARYSFVAVPRVGVLYRIGNSNSMSSNLLNQERDCLKVINKAFENASESLQPLKKKSLVNLYQYLSFKATEGLLDRQQGWLAVSYYWRALKIDPSIIFKYRIDVTLIIYLKILAALTIPSKLTQTLIDVWRSLFKYSATRTISKQKSLTTD